MSSLSVIDILFLITVLLLVLNGLKNGFVASLVSLISIPLALGVAYFFGAQFSAFLTSNGLTLAPLVSFLILFFLTAVVLHIIGSSISSFVRRIPIIGTGDSLLGGVVGFVEAWLLWLFLLIVLGVFLTNIQQHVAMIGSYPSVNTGQLQQWHDFYNQAVTNSLFAKVNGFFIRELPNVPQPS